MTTFGLDEYVYDALRAGTAVVVVPTLATPALGGAAGGGRDEGAANDSGGNEQLPPASRPAHDQYPLRRAASIALKASHGTVPVVGSWGDGTKEPIALG